VQVTVYVPAAKLLVGNASEKVPLGYKVVSADNPSTVMIT
jgi:hypothetical protein